MVLGLAGVVVAIYSQRPGTTVPAMSPEVELARKDLEVRDGRFFAPGSAIPFTGWMLDQYQDGSPRLRSAVSEGRLHGESIGWFTNGVVELREEFVAVQPHGRRTTWHPNGQQRAEGRLQEGRQQGRYRQWDEAGHLIAEAQFVDGKPHGLSLAWHADGSLKAEALMHHGEIQSRHFYPQGVRREPALPQESTKSPSTAQIQ